MKKIRQLGGKLTRLRLLLIFGAVWLASVVGVGVPAWLTAVRQHQEVEDVETRIAELDRWSVAGMWLARNLPARQAAIDARWDELFPAERHREELFLDLARIADESGVQAFELAEINGAELNFQSAPSDDDMDDDMNDEAPLAELDAYRVKANFQGRYDQIAKFIGGLNGIKRSVSVHNLDIRPVRDAVTVELELDVHVSKTTQS